MEAIVGAIDKLDKIGEEGVKKELIQLSLPNEATEKLLSLCKSYNLINNIPDLMNLEDSEEALNDLGFITQNFENNINTQKGIDRKSTRLNSSHTDISRMPSSA